MKRKVKENIRCKINNSLSDYESICTLHLCVSRNDFFRFCTFKTCMLGLAILKSLLVIDWFGFKAL